VLVIVIIYQEFENYVLQPATLRKAADVSGLSHRECDDPRTHLGVVGASMGIPIATLPRSL